VFSYGIRGAVSTEYILPTLFAADAINQGRQIRSVHAREVRQLVHEARRELKEPMFGQTYRLVAQAYENMRGSGVSSQEVRLALDGIEAVLQQKGNKDEKEQARIILREMHGISLQQIREAQANTSPAVHPILKVVPGGLSPRTAYTTNRTGYNIDSGMRKAAGSLK